MSYQNKITNGIQSNNTGARSSYDGIAKDNGIEITEMSASGKGKGGRMRQYINDDSRKLYEILHKVKNGEFTTLDDDLFIGKMIYESHPWDYPIEVNSQDYKEKSDYQERTKTQIKNAELAKTIFAISYDRLVLKQANNYYKLMQDHLPEDEIAANGRKGMAIAMDKYDYRKGYKFSSYLTWYVFRDVHRDSRGLGHIVNIPAAEIKRFVEIEKRLNEGENLDEILTDFNMKRTDYLKLKNADKKHASLDLKISDGHDSATLMDVCQTTTNDPTDNENNASIHELIQNDELMRDLALSIAALPVKQRMLISKLYGPNRVINGKERPVSDTRCREELGMGKLEYKETKELAFENLKQMMEYDYGWDGNLIHADDTEY